MRFHPNAVGNGWEFVDRVGRPVRYSKSALPQHLDVINRDTDNDMDIDPSNIDMEDSNNDDEVLSEGEEEYDDIELDLTSEEDTDED